MIKKTLFVLVLLFSVIQPMQLSRKYLKSEQSSSNKKKSKKLVIIFKKSSVPQNYLESQHFNTDKRGRTVLFEANNLEKVRECLLKGVNPNVVDDDGNTAFHHFVMTNPFLAQQFLAQDIKDLDISSENFFGVRPLESAARLGNYALVKQLLETISVRYLPQHIHFWNWMGRYMPEKCEFFIKYFGNLFIPDQLLLAASSAALYHINFFSLFLKKYLEKGGSPNIIIPHTFQSPLSIAVQYDLSLVKLLLEKGADVNMRDEVYLTTPLMHAACKGTSQIITLLLSHGAEINARDKDGRTPLMYATFNTIDTVTALLAKDANKNACDYSKKTAYRYAFENNNQRALSLLAKKYKIIVVGNACIY